MNVSVSCFHKQRKKYFDRQITLKDIRKSLGKSSTTANTIMKEHLAVDKVCFPWCPIDLSRNKR